MSSFEVSWSPKAKATYFNIINYINSEWTYKEVEAFINRTDEAIAHIKQNPLLFPYSIKSNTRRCVVVPQVSLYYEVDGDIINLLIFWSNRQDSAKLKFS
ncbi:MAG: type II toxin-antitoxin system RelE/ParE family toxin [Bacteroidota bacterium]